MKLRKSTDADSAPRITGSASFLDNWRVAGVSAAGEEHIHGSPSMPCQDAFLYGGVGDMIWGAVADGVGSERLSQYGAKAAVEAVGDFLMNGGAAIGGGGEPAFPKEAAARIARYCRARIVETAAGFGVPDRELATTLQALIIDESLGQLLYLAVGDGHCLIQNPDGSVDVLGYRREGPQLGTSSLGFDEHLDYLFQARLNLAEVTGCVLISDGLDRLFVKKGLESAAAAAGDRQVGAMVTTLREAETEIESVSRFGRIITNRKFREEMRDDKTILVFARTSPYGGPTAATERMAIDDGTSSGPSPPGLEEPVVAGDSPAPAPAAPRPRRTQRIPMGLLTLVIVSMILVLEIAQLVAEMAASRAEEGSAHAGEAKQSANEVSVLPESDSSAAREDDTGEQAPNAGSAESVRPPRGETESAAPSTNAPAVPKARRRQSNPPPERPEGARLRPPPTQANDLLQPATPEDETPPPASTEAQQPSVDPTPPPEKQENRAR